MRLSLPPLSLLHKVLPDLLPDETGLRLVRVMVKRLAVLRPLVLVVTLIHAGVAVAMTSLSEEEMADVTGQALFWSDKIDPSGAGTGAAPSDFTFYRLGLDTQVNLNMNIAKLQLGCGGQNDALSSNAACDIDMDYVRLMGRNGTDAGDPVSSDFKLIRPYISYAIENDDTKTQREIVGIKVGSQSADGYFAVGRRYAADQVNQEHGGTCTGAAEGDGALACHTGLNSISGWLDLELSGQIPVTIQGLLSYNGMACMGNTSFTNDACDASHTFLRQISGTRMTDVIFRDTELQLSGGIVGLFGEANADIFETLRFLHGFALVGSDNFFLSSQREQVSWPGYDHKDTGEYAATANTGWWMNAPNVKVLDFVGARQTLGLYNGEAEAAFSEGVNIINPELGQAPPQNCFGSAQFC